MPSKKITIASVKELSPGEIIWDTEIKGFGCRRQQDGKVFVVKYRVGKGRAARQRFYKIGRLGSPWTPDSAREECKRILALVFQGHDPAAKRDLQKAAASVNEAFDLFIAGSHGKRAQRTVAEYRRLYDKLAKARLGRHRVEDVLHEDIQKLHSSHSSTPPQANRLLQMLSAFFNWCERNGHRPRYTNPCRDIEKYEEFYKDRFLSEKELVLLSQALSAYEEQYGHFKEKSHKKGKTGQGEINAVTTYITAAIRLLIFTGARRNEIVTLKWEDVDFENRQLRLPQSKTGKKTIYLSAPALEVLSKIPRFEGNPYVICGAKEGTHLVNIKDAWERIRKMATVELWQEDKKIAALIKKAKSQLPEDCRIDALFKTVQVLAKKSYITLPNGLMDVTPHTLRHTYASSAVVSGQHLRVLGSLLGHSNTRTTERYANLANDMLQQANEAISTRLSQTMSGKTKNNVAKLKQRIH